MTSGFVICLYAMQWAWGWARGSALEHMVIDKATVGTASWLIQQLTPDVHAMAMGSRIQAAGGSINVLNGCEGTELLFLMSSALLVYPMRWRPRLAGLGLGLVLVFVLNQIRLLLLFYSYRSDRILFDQLHGLLAPVTLMMLTLAYVTGLIRLHDARPDRSVQP